MAAAPVLLDPNTLQREQILMAKWAGSRRRRLASGIDIPAVAVPVQRYNQLAAPNFGAGNQVQLVSYTVPANYEALICGVVLGFLGNPSALPGDVIYTVDVNRPLGAAATVGYTERDFAAVAFGLPMMLDASRPWPVEWRYATGQTVRVKAYTVQNITPGVPNFVLAALVGYEWPARH